MRRWLWPLPLLLFVSMFFAGGCSSDFNPLEYEEVKLPPLSEEQRVFCYGEDWYTWEKFKNEKGMVVKSERYDGSISFEIKLLSRPERFPVKYPLNMPAEYKVDFRPVRDGSECNCYLYDFYCYTKLFKLGISRNGLA